MDQIRTKAYSYSHLNDLALVLFSVCITLLLLPLMDNAFRAICFFFLFSLSKYFQRKFHNALNPSAPFRIVQAFLRRSFLLYNRFFFFFFNDTWINLQSAILMILLTFILKSSPHTDSANQFFFTGPLYPNNVMNLYSYYLLVFRCEWWRFSLIYDNRSYLLFLLLFFVVISFFFSYISLLFLCCFITHRSDFIAKINDRINYEQRYFFYDISAAWDAMPSFTENTVICVDKCPCISKSLDWKCVS